MANYPTTLPLCEGSTEKWVDPFLLSRARDNSVKGRRTGTAKKKAFQVVHTRISQALKDSFETFYDANRSVTLTFAWIDGTSHTVIFSDSEIEWVPEKNALWSVKLLLLKV